MRAYRPGYDWHSSGGHPAQSFASGVVPSSRRASDRGLASQVDEDARFARDRASCRESGDRLSRPKLCGDAPLVDDGCPPRGGQAVTPGRMYPSMGSGRRQPRLQERARSRLRLYPDLARIYGRLAALLAFGEFSSFAKCGLEEHAPMVTNLMRDAMTTAPDSMPQVQHFWMRQSGVRRPVGSDRPSPLRGCNGGPE